MKTFEEYVQNNSLRDLTTGQLEEMLKEYSDTTIKEDAADDLNLGPTIEPTTEMPETAPTEIPDDDADIVEKTNPAQITGLQHIDRIILVGQQKLKSIQDLNKKDGIALDFVDVEDFSYAYEENAITVTSRKESFTISQNDIPSTLMLVRSGYSKMNVCGFLESVKNIGILISNEVDPVKISSDKFLTAELLNRNNISQPNYCLITSDDVHKKDTKKAEKKIAALTENADDNTKYVCKILSGHGGRGVFICRKSNIVSILQCLFAIDPKCPVLVQEYCDLKDGDIRAHVITINGRQKIVSSIIRLKGDKDFRTNLSLGNEMADYKMTPEQEQLALDAAKVSGLVWCGVDIMPLKDGRNMIAEFNGAPGPASNIADKDIESVNYEFFKEIINTINMLCKKK